MALANVQSIMEALKQADARALQSRQLDIEQQRASAQTEAEQARIQQQQDSLEENKRQFDAQHALAQKAADLLHLQKMQEIGKGIKAGEPIPGETVSPAAQGSTGGFTPINPSQATSEVHTLPDNMGQVVVPTLLQQAKDVAARARITGAPAEEAKTREAQALQEAETNRQVRVAQETGLQRLQEIAEQRQMMNEQAQKNNDAAAARTRMEIAGRMSVARLNLTGGLSAEGGPNSFPVNQILSDIRDGKITEEQVKKDYPKQATALFGTARGSGFAPITNDEMGKLKDFEAVAQAVPIIKQMNDIRNNNPTQVLIPGTDAYKQYVGLRDSLGGMIPAISRTISGVKRFNTTEMNQYIDALIPGRNPLTTSPSTNLQKLRTFVQNDVQDAFNTNFSRLPQEQQKILRNNVGLDNLPYIGKAMTNPGQPAEVIPGMPIQPQQPQQNFTPIPGATHVWTPNGIQPIQQQPQQR